MYVLGVKRDFDAQHYLIGGDWGAENQPHTHHYRLELQLEAEGLDQHGYLIDIVEVEKFLDQLVMYYKDQMLNDKPEFKGLNPSIEHFARIACDRLRQQIPAQNLCAVTVVIWENEIAWASYRYTMPRSLP